MNKRVRGNKMSKIVWKPATLLAPVPPTLVSCGTLEKPNALAVAWTGIINSNPAMTYISIRPERHSHQIIKESGEFVINLTTKETLRALDYCGVRSGVDTDKFADCHLTAERASQVNAPMVGECPVSIECRVKEIMSLGSHDMFMAEIVAVNVDDEYLDEKGKLCLSRAGLVAYSHGEYFALGKKMGYFGFSVKKRDTVRYNSNHRDKKKK